MLPKEARCCHTSPQSGIPDLRPYAPSVLRSSPRPPPPPPPPPSELPQHAVPHQGRRPLRDCKEAAVVEQIDWTRIPHAAGRTDDCCVDPGS